jgi:hypothetical protein
MFKAVITCPLDVDREKTLPIIIPAPARLRLRLRNGIRRKGLCGLYVEKVMDCGIVSYFFSSLYVSVCIGCLEMKGPGWGVREKGSRCTLGKSSRSSAAHMSPRKFRLFLRSVLVMIFQVRHLAYLYLVPLE